MNFAGILLMMIWGSFLVFSIGAWIFIMLGRQSSELNFSQDSQDDDTFEQGELL